LIKYDKYFQKLRKGGKYSTDFLALIGAKEVAGVSKTHVRAPMTDSDSVMMLSLQDFYHLTLLYFSFGFS
jgi:hypothetical protein